MKKPPNFFMVEIDPPGEAWIGVERGKIIAISLGVGKVYTAPIEKVYATLQRWHARENPSGKKRRRLFTSSEEYRKYRREHPEEFQS